MAQLGRWENPKFFTVAQRTARHKKTTQQQTAKLPVNHGGRCSKCVE
jgi:hypothetical protein